MEKSLAAAVENGKLSALADGEIAGVVIERPRNPEHGDYACGVSLKLAGKAKMAPMQIAQEILQHAGAFQGVAGAEIAAPGYINFRLQKPVLQHVLHEIHAQGNNFGRSTVGAGKRAMVEYVSANPTGDLHIGHGRNAVFGSCLANLMKFSGYDVQEEFYVNDAGAQILQLGQCAFALYRKLLGQECPYPTEGYPEESIKHFVEKVIEKEGDKYLSLSESDGAAKLADVTKAVIQQDQAELLEKLGIKFDLWFSETPLHTEGKVDEALAILKDSSLSYESEGALWLKAKELGDERDRVLVKGDGKKTYLAADAAYHLNKYDRGFDLMINIWGADHHGQVPGLKAVVQALGKDPNKLEVVLTQIVNLSRDGQIVRMSKRMGTVVLLSDLLEEVGCDAVRYYLAESSPLNPISFDLELAKKHSKENPAFYIQYAHARCCAILRRALEPGINTETKAEEPPPVSPAEWQDWLKSYKASPEVFAAAFEDDPELFAHQKKLVMQLASLPEEVEDAMATRLPGKLARYAYDVANDLQKFYEVCRVITDDKEVTRARLGLILATKQVLANTLGIIGVTAVERM